jgi:hypothetical protein
MDLGMGRPRLNLLVHVLARSLAWAHTDSLGDSFMAVRTGAGTGVVVSLVVFVLTTVFLLVMTIVFYAGKTKEIEERVKAEQALGLYVTSAQKNTDQFRGFEAAANANRQSVAGYLGGRHDALMTYVAGDASTYTLDSLRSELSRLGVPEQGGVVRTELTNFNNNLRNATTEIENLTQQKTDLENQLNQKQEEITQLRASQQQERDAVESRIAGYRESTEEYKQRLDEAIADLGRAKDDLRSNYEGQIEDLQNEADNLNRELLTLKGRIRQFEELRNETRLRAQDPATLVDGKIIEVPGSNDEVYIDRGKLHRIVLGMTFEVYSDKASIRLNPQTGDIPRGKASLQVIKVGDATSTCKVTRATPGQPVVRGDVIANAIYDPEYRFKFLVHGKFDVDADGRPSETEAEYLRSVVLEWGGSVVTGDDLPGDLDFLVLGVTPPMPPPPPASASEVVVTDYIQKRRAADLYNQLLNQAREAQIPVLNANRFFILIGHTER